jgi:hypothetical protein
MSFLERYTRHLEKIRDRLDEKSSELAIDVEGAANKLEGVYQAGRDAYVAGRLLVPKGIPRRPTTWDDGMEFIKDASGYFQKVLNFIRTKVNPVINSVLLLASGNRDIDTALDEVQSKNNDPTTLLLVDRAREIVDLIRRSGYEAEAIQQVDEFNDPHDLITDINAKSIQSQLDRVIEAVENIAPYNKIAPLGSVYSDSLVPWIMDLTAEEISMNVYEQSIPTYDTGLVPPSHAGGAAYWTAFSLSDDSAAGLVNFPPKESAYKWTLVATVSAHVINDNGTGVQGDVLAAGTDFASFYAWTSATLGGAPITSNTAVMRNATALTVDGDEQFNLQAELAVELTSSAVANVSNIVHFDLAFGGVTTEGVAGLAYTASTTIPTFTVSNVRLVGYPKTTKVDYSLITYRDENGVFSINKDDSFITYFGKLALETQEDPNYSVHSIMIRRLAGRSHQVGQAVSVLKRYSELYHTLGDRIDDKYNRLGCVNGIDDMVGIITYLDRTLPPFGNSLAQSVTEPDDITYLFATFIVDLKMVREYMLSDKNIQKVLAQYIPFSTSSNVHF